MKYMLISGEFVGEVNLFSYGRLCYLLDRVRFTNFNSDYSAMWTDDSTCIVTAIGTNGTKAVSDYGAVGPVELWAIQQTIDNIRQEIEWKKVK